MSCLQIKSVDRAIEKVVRVYGQAMIERVLWLSTSFFRGISVSVWWPLLGTYTLVHSTGKHHWGWKLTASAMGAATD